MANAFNLTAELNLRGPSNVKTVVADIRRQLGSINANVNLKIDPSSAKSVSQLNASLKNFNTTLNTTSTSANNAAKALNNLAKSISNINVKNLPQQINSSASAVNKLSSSAASSTKALQTATTEMQEFGKQSYLAVKRFAAFTSVTSIIFGVTNAITSGVKAFIDYDKQLVKLQQVTGENAAGLQNLSKTITVLATGFGVASSDMTEVASTLAQAGLSARDTERALKALALSSLAPSFDDMNETVEGSIALMRQFGISADQLEVALGSINEVSAKFAVEASDIITAIQRTGGVFATASKGVSEGTDALNEFIAVFTSVRATTRESAETIATGLRTIFTRIQRGSTIEALKEYGVNLTDLDGKFVGAYKAIELLSSGLNKLDPRDLKFSNIVEELGGFRQIGKVIPLIQQFAVAQNALKVAQTGQGSLALDAAKAQDSLSNKITKVKEEFFALFREIGNSDGFQTLIRGALDLSSALIRIADSIKGVLPALGIFAAFKGVSGITQFTSGFFGAAKTKSKVDGGRIYKFQTGGVVPGSGRGDKVPALLEPGEVVMSNNAVNKYGRENLVRMNKYAKGGKTKSQTYTVNELINSKILKFMGSGSTLEKDDSVYGTINNVDLQTPLTGDEITSIYQSFPLSDKLKSIYNNSKNRGLLFAVRNKKISNIGKISSQLGITDKELTDFAKITGKAEKSWGIAYENIIRDRFNLQSVSDDPMYPVDTIERLANDKRRFGEIKFKSRPEDEITLIRKLLTNRLFSNQKNRYFKENILNKQDINKNIGIIDYFFAGDKQKHKEDFYTNMSIGGKIQKFSAGGKALGARSKFKTLSETELAQLSTKDLIAYAKRQARDIFTTGGAGMAIASEFVEVPPERIIPELESELTTYLGKRGFWREKIAPFASSPKARVATERKTDSRTLRRIAATAGGVDVSALKDVSTEALLKYAEQAPRAPKEVLEKTIAKYSNISSIKPKFQEWGKNPSGGVFSDVVAGFEDQIRRELEEPNKSRFDSLIKAGSLDSYKAMGGKDGHIPPIKKAIYEITGVTEKNTGGLIARFNAGGIVKRFSDGQKVLAAEKPKTISPQSLIGGPGNLQYGEWITKLDSIIKENGFVRAPQSNSILINGKNISLSDIFSPRQLSSTKFQTKVGTANIAKLEKLRSDVADAYTEARANVIEANRTRTTSEIASTKQESLLFGAAGMYGKRFPPKEIVFGTADGLKQQTKATVFGSLLDKDAAERQARLNKRKIMLQAAGVDPSQDSETIAIRSAPTTETLSDFFGYKASVTGVSKANKRLALDAVTEIARSLSPDTKGSKIFLDFDRTLAFGSDKIGGKSNKKIPDYSAFGDPKKVAMGLSQAKLSGLGLRLRTLVSDLNSNQDGLGKELLKRMFVVSARPKETMPLIARWLRNQGLRIPPENVSGVGGAGVSDVAMAKAEKIAKIAESGSVFIDDDTKNINAAREQGIRSIQYGSRITKKAKKQAAQQEGLQFEQFISEQLPKNLKTKILGPDGEGIDFPYGLGSQISQTWFRDSRLADIPVDTKRTLTGPGGTIKKNILSYLRTNGFAVGGKASRKVDFERGVGPSPFVAAKIKKLGPEIYDLQKASGLSNREFDDAVFFAKSNDFSLEEFKKYLQQRIEQKRSKKSLTTETSSLLNSISSPSLSASTDQINLARSLMGEPDAQYNPKYDNARSQRFATGGEARSIDVKLAKEQLGKFIGKSTNDKNSYWQNIPGIADGMQIVENGRIVFYGPEKIGFSVLKNRKRGGRSGSPYEIQEDPTSGSWPGEFAGGGYIDKFAKAGKVEFGTGETAFPKRISNAYEREERDVQLKKASEQILQGSYSSPKDESMRIDIDKVREAHTIPLDKSRFLSTFTGKIKRNTLYQDIADFTKSIGLPRENIDLALPEMIDFIPNLNSLGKFDRTGMSERGVQSLDLSEYGFTKSQEQDEYGYKKLIEEKKKEIAKIQNTPTKTYDDGSFSYDNISAKKAWEELSILQKNYGMVSSLRSQAREKAIKGIQDKASVTGRGSILLKTSGPYGGDSSTLYHEMTHQLINGLRTRNAESFVKYKERVLQLFTGDNDDLSEAFDKLNSNYSSADVVYGKAYKVANLDQIIRSNRNKSGYSNSSQNTEALSLWTKSLSIQKASQFKPLNPDVNQALLNNGVQQSYIDRIEDSGKEEFLTTLVQNSNRLDELLSSVLDSTLNELFSSAGIQRQSYSVGGLAEIKEKKYGKPETWSSLTDPGTNSGLLGFETGGMVPALVSNGEAYVPPKVAKRIGYDTLNRMNQADRNGMRGFAGGGGISVFKGPGSGTSDSIGPIGLPEGSFIIREKATKALGLAGGGSVKKFLKGGKTPSTKVAESVTSFDIVSNEASKALSEALKRAVSEAFKDIRSRNPDISASDALTQARKNIDVQASYGTFRAAEQGDQNAANIVADAQSKQVLAIIKQIRAIDIGVSVAAARAAAERKVADAWGGLYKRTKQQEQQLGLLSKSMVYAGKAVETIKSIPKQLTKRLEGLDNSKFNTGLRDAIGGQTGFMASMALGALAGQGENIFGKETGIRSGSDSSNAFTAAGLEAGTTTLSAGLATASSLAAIPAVGPFIAALTLGVTAVSAWTSAVEAGKKAAEEFAKNQREKRIQDLDDKLAKSLEKLSKNSSDVNQQEVIKIISQKNNEQIDNFIKNDKARSREVSETGPNSGFLSTSSTFLKLATNRLTTGFGGSEVFDLTDGGTRRVFDTAKISRKEQLERNSQDAKTSEASAEAARVVIDTKIQKGSSLESIQKMPDFGNLVQTLARTDAAFIDFEKNIEEQIKLGRVNPAEKQDRIMKRIELMFGAGGKRLLEKFGLVASDSAAKAARAMEEADIAGRKLAMSFDKLVRSFDQALGRTVYELDNLRNASNNYIDALSGNAKVANITSKDTNVLTNPEAYTDKERESTFNRVSGFFGEDQKAVKDMLKISSTDFSNNIIGSIQEKLSKNRTLTVGEGIESARQSLNDQLKNSPADVRKQILSKFEGIVGQLDQETKGQTDPDKVDKLAEQIQKELGTNIVEVADKVRQMGVKIAEFTTGALNELINATNKAAEAELAATKLRFAAQDVGVEARDKLNQTLGRSSPSVQDIRVREQDKVARLTGGITDPTQITNNIVKDSETLKSKQNELQTLIDKQGVTDKDPGYQKLTQDISGLGNKIKKEQEALDKLANSTETASAALSKIQEIQQRMAGQQEFLDKLATATPEEAEKLGSSLQRLQVNLNGGVNSIRNSRDAQKAFIETLKQTGDPRQAQRAGMAVMAQQRAETMSLFKELRPILELQQGKENVDRMEASLRQGVYSEAGLTSNPILAQLANQTVNFNRDPASDPRIRENIDLYNQNVATQQKAMQEQARIQDKISSDTLKEASIVFSQAVKTFVDNLNTIRTNQKNVMEKPEVEPAVGVAIRNKGGIIYASTGTLVNFKPKGTDTVPAMLTPGEFVVNAKATARHLPLLKSINSGEDVSGYNHGGVVYLAKGGRLKKDETIQQDRAARSTNSRSRLSGMSMPGMGSFAPVGLNMSGMESSTYSARTDMKQYKNRAEWAALMNINKEQRTKQQKQRIQELKKYYKQKQDYDEMLAAGRFLSYPSNSVSRAESAARRGNPYEVNVGLFGSTNSRSRLSGMSMPGMGSFAPVGLNMSGMESSTYSARTDMKQYKNRDITETINNPNGKMHTPAKMADFAMNEERKDYWKKQNEASGIRARKNIENSINNDKLQANRDKRLGLDKVIQNKLGSEMRSAGELADPKLKNQFRTEAINERFTFESNRGKTAAIPSNIDIKNKTITFAKIDPKTGLPLTDKEGNKLYTRPVPFSDLKAESLDRALAIGPIDMDQSQFKDKGGYEEYKKEYEKQQSDAKEFRTRLKNKEDTAVLAPSSGLSLDDVQKMQDKQKMQYEQNMPTFEVKISTQDRLGANIPDYKTTTPSMTSMLPNVKGLAKPETSSKPYQDPLNDKGDTILKNKEEKQRQDEAKAKEEAATRQAEQAAANQTKTAQETKDKQDGLWVNSSNFGIRALGYIGGLGEASGNVAYGAANVVAGAATVAASPVIGYFAGNSPEEVARGEKLAAQTRAMQEKHAAMGVLGPAGTDQQKTLAQAQKSDYRGESSTAAAARVGAKAMIQGAYTAVEAAQAVAGQGPIMTGNQTWLNQGDDDRVQQAGPYGGATRIAQNIGFTASQGVQVATGLGMTTGTSIAGKAGKVLGAVDDVLSNPVGAAAKAAKGAKGIVTKAPDFVRSVDDKLTRRITSMTPEEYRASQRTRSGALKSDVKARASNRKAEQWIEDTSKEFFRQPGEKTTRNYGFSGFSPDTPVVQSKYPSYSASLKQMEEMRKPGGVNAIDINENARWKFGDEDLQLGTSINRNSSAVDTIDPLKVNAAEAIARQAEKRQVSLVKPRNIEISDEANDVLSFMNDMKASERSTTKADISTNIPINKAQQETVVRSSAKPVTTTPIKTKRQNSNVRLSDMQNLSDSAQKYLSSMPQTQRDAFEALSFNVNKNKQEIFLRDIIEKAAVDDLRWLDDPGSASGHLDKVANKWSKYYQTMGTKDLSSMVKKARGVFTKKGSLPGADSRPVIAINSAEDVLSTGVHKSTHFAADMVDKLNVNYKDLTEMVDKNLLDSFLDTDYDKIIQGLKTSYSSKFVKNSSNAVAGSEFFTTLNQAAVDPRTKDLFAESPKAKEILSKMWKAHGYSTGGIVYANNGALIAAQNQGSDTVPAMLTPGEFVVNRNAAQKHMPVLHAINKGYYNRGGMVEYLNNGGVVGPKYYTSGSLNPVQAIKEMSSNRSVSGVNNTVSSDISDMIGKAQEMIKLTISEAVGAITTVSETAKSVSQGAQQLGQYLSEINIPETVNFTGNVEQVHRFNGAEAANHILGTLGPTMEKTADNKVVSAFNSFNKISGEGNFFQGDASTILGARQV